MSLQTRLTALATGIANYIRDSVTPRLLPTGGTTGQVVAKTSGGYGWSDAGGESEIAEGPIDVLGSVRRPANAVAALSIDCSLGNVFTKSVSANSTFAFTGAPSAGRDYALKLIITHTGGTITWPTSVVWPGGTAPPLTTGKTHIFWFSTSNAGVAWRGACLSNYAS